MNSEKKRETIKYQTIEDFTTNPKINEIQKFATEVKKTIEGVNTLYKTLSKEDDTLIYTVETYEKLRNRATEVLTNELNNLLTGESNNLKTTIFGNGTVSLNEQMEPKLYEKKYSPKELNVLKNLFSYQIQNNILDNGTRMSKDLQKVVDDFVNAKYPSIELMRQKQYRLMSKSYEIISNFYNDNLSN